MAPARAGGDRGDVTTSFRDTFGRSSVASALAEHERLLGAGAPGSSVVVVDAPAVSYGVGQRRNAAYLGRAAAHGIATVGRTSGGSGVLHGPGDVVWALVLPRSDPRVAAGFVRAYARLGRGVVAALDRVGVAAAWGVGPSTAPEYCPLSGRGEVLLVGDAVVGGAGQHATAAAVLHHGFVAWDVDRPAVERLFGWAPGGPSGRLAGVTEFARRLTEGALAQALAESLGREAGKVGP